MAREEVDFDRFVRISAELAEGDRKVSDVLASHGLDRAAWEVAALTHQGAIARDAMEGSGDLADRFATAFAAAQDDLKPIPDLTPEAWAALGADVDARGVDALHERGLREADYLRLARAWARRTAADATLAKRTMSAIYAAKAARAR